MNLFIFVKDKINKTNAAVIIDGPDGEFNSNDENKPIILTGRGAADGLFIYGGADCCLMNSGEREC